MKFSSIAIHLAIVGVFQQYFSLAEEITNDDFATDDFVLDGGSSSDDNELPNIPAEQVRFNKFGVIDTTFQGLPLGPDDYPISDNPEVVTFLKEGSDGESVVDINDDFEVIYPVKELIDIVGGLPDHPSSNPRAPYWRRLERVIDKRNLGRNKLAREALADVMQQPLRWTNFTVLDVANAVYDEYPGLHQAEFIEDLIVFGLYGPVEFDDGIIPRRSLAQFLRGIIAVADISTWSHGVVGPHNFGAKWSGGRARPEEIAWLVRTGQVDAPRFIRRKINRIRNFNQATDFTRYRGNNAREGRMGSPRHPTWPAMHSAGSNLSFWAQVVMNLTPTQACEAKKIDWAVSYARTVAAVHFEDDNLAGLEMGQEVVARALPEYFPVKYGSNASNIRIKVNQKRFKWADYDPLEDCNSL